jgi:hypothetical protein
METHPKLILAVVAVVLVNRNRQLLVGEEADPRIRAAAIRSLLDMPEVARVTYLHLEIVGPRMVSVIGDVDLAGDHTASHVAVHRGRSRRSSVPLQRWPALSRACRRRTSHHWQSEQRNPPQQGAEK